MDTSSSVKLGFQNNLSERIPHEICRLKRSNTCIKYLFDTITAVNRYIIISRSLVQEQSLPNLSVQGREHVQHLFLALSIERGNRARVKAASAARDHPPPLLLTSHRALSLPSPPPPLCAAVRCVGDAFLPLQEQRGKAQAIKGNPSEKVHRGKANMSAVDNLLLDSDDEDLGDMDLSSITLEEILREEELASKAAEGLAASPSATTASSASDDDDAFFSPATFTLALAPMPGMDVVPAGGSVAKSAASTVLERAKSITDVTTSVAATGSTAGFRSALEIAEARERQLLSCVGVELVSPLQVKRRLRANARTKSLSKRKPAAKKKGNASASASAAASTTATIGKDAADKKGGKATGVVKVQPMEAISRQLRKNIEFKEYGPGSPTVVAIHSKFIAIGTSKGLVIIFDHFQNVRC